MKLFNDYSFKSPLPKWCGTLFSGHPFCCLVHTLALIILVAFFAVVITLGKVGVLK